MLAYEISKALGTILVNSFTNSNMKPRDFTGNLKGRNFFMLYKHFTKHYIYIYIYMYVSIYAYIYTHTHTHIYIYTPGQKYKITLKKEEKCIVYNF